jgi:hypothetical protein
MCPIDAPHKLAPSGDLPNEPLYLSERDGALLALKGFDSCFTDLKWGDVLHVK